MNALDELAGISRAEAEARALLQSRFDRKYLVPAAVLEPLLRRVAPLYAVVEERRARWAPYASDYFDTPDLALYRSHLQGRRRRYKVRTRTYADGTAVLEVKVKGARGLTVKERMPYDVPGVLTPYALGFVNHVLRSAYGEYAPPSLVRSARTTYFRATLVQRFGSGRFTCDRNLWFCGVPSRPDLVLLESKSAGPHTPVDHELRRLGIRPVSVSKYCLAVAAHYHGIRCNRWRPVLRELFVATP